MSQCLPITSPRVNPRVSQNASLTSVITRWASTVNRAVAAVPMMVLVVLERFLEVQLIFYVLQTLRAGLREILDPRCVARIVSARLVGQRDHFRPPGPRV